MASDPSGRLRTPARVLCLEPGAARWVDVAPYTLAHLQHAIACGFPVAKVPLADGRWHIYDFSVLLRVDEADPNGPRAALAWIDEGGNYFFPAGVRPEDVVIEPAGGVTMDEAVAIVRCWTFDGAVLTRVRSHVPTESMLRRFAERKRTLGNVKLAWYGGSPGDVEMAAASGLFWMNNWPLLGGDRAHGQGMHLSPLRFPHLSMNIAGADHNGEAHVLLCRIVHGVPEVVNAGAATNWLSHRMVEERSVGGIDDLCNPSWYVLWSKHVNKCIMPLCIVSFTKLPMIQDLGTPIQMVVNMQKLHDEFRRFLPSSKMETLDYYFNNDMGHSYNFSRAVCELVGAAMFVGAVLRSLEH